MNNNSSFEPIYTLLTEKARELYIPLYQRDYSWTSEEIGQLMDDIKEFLEKSRNPKELYFLGNIILSNPTNPGDGCEVIDGQQRITTYMLLLKAFVSFIKNKERIEVIESPEYQKMRDDLESAFKIVDKRGEPRLRMRNHKISNILNAILLDRELPDEQNNLVMNFEEIYQYLADNFQDIDKIRQLYGFLKKSLVIADIWIHDVNTYDLFDSINSKGKELTVYDKLRNLLFIFAEKTNLSDSEKQQLDIDLESVKNSFNKNDSSKTTEFLRFFASIKSDDGYLSSTSYPQEIYKQFKRILKNKIEKDYSYLGRFIEDMINAKDIYHDIEKYSTKKFVPSDEFGFSMTILGKQLKSIFFPIMYVTYLEHSTIDNQNESITYDDEFKKIISVLDEYKIKMAMAGKNMKDNRSYVRIPKELKEEKISAIELKNFLLVTAQSSIRMPTNDDVLFSINNVDLYKTNKLELKYILWKANAILETSDLKKTKERNIANNYNLYNSLTIEHVLPQNPDKWIDYLALQGDPMEIHRSNCFRFGNLTLTSYNGEQSNLSFEKKKEILSGVHLLEMNKEILDESKWDEEVILDRGKRLANILINYYNKLAIL